MCMHKPLCTCENQRTTFRSSFSSSTTWVLGIETKVTNLVAGKVQFHLLSHLADLVSQEF